MTRGMRPFSIYRSFRMPSSHTGRAAFFRSLSATAASTITRKVFAMSAQRWLVLLISAAAPGCAGPDTTTHVADAETLVEKRTGMLPDWSSPWDESSAGPANDEVLDLPTALVAALRNNRELRAELETIGQADADLVQAGLMANPVINFMMMFPSGGGRTMLRASGLPMQPLQDLWLIPSRKKVAAAALRQAVLRAADRAVETVAATKRAYVETQYAQRAVELIRENIKLVTESESVIEARVSAGRSTQVEVNVTHIRGERLRSELLAMEANLSAGKYELLRLMGTPEVPTHWRVTPLAEIAESTSKPPDETVLILLAADQRLDLKSREWEAEGALRRITLSRHEGWPDLALGLAFERAPRGRTRGASIRALAADQAAQGFVNGINQVEPMPEVAQIAPLPRPTREVTYTLGPMMEMELPIFDWGQAQTAKSIHGYQQALASYDAALHEIVRTIRTTLARLNEAHAQLELYRNVILPEVERNLVLASETYVAGQTDLTIYIQTQEDVIATRQKMLEFLKTLRILEADLERAVGGATSAEEADTTAAPKTEVTREPR